MVDTSILINRIDSLAEELSDLEKQIRQADDREEILPLLDLLAKQSNTLKDIYNEFCWLELQ